MLQLLMHLLRITQEMLYNFSMKDYQVCVLSKRFYDKYPSKNYPEILKKGNRPYLILLVNIRDNFYGIPFRSNINHKYYFKIINNRGLKEGLDYSKAVVVCSGDIASDAYLRPNTLPQIDEFIDIIIRDFTEFLDRYYNIVNKTKHTKREKMILHNCTLKYFPNNLKKFNYINDDIKIDFELSATMKDLVKKAEIADIFDNYGLYMNLADAIDSQGKLETTHHELDETQWIKLTQRYCL